MQLTDWFVNQLIYVDVTNALLIMYVYAVWRVCVTLGRGELWPVRGSRRIGSGRGDVLRRQLAIMRW
jgi:hypothetical protein